MTDSMVNTEASERLSSRLDRLLEGMAVSAGETAWGFRQIAKGWSGLAECATKISSAQDRAGGPDA